MVTRTDKGTEDPRRARSRTAMLEAAFELLASDGPTAVTPARVAAAAGVHRATAYRLWPDADQLLFEVMTEAELPFFREPTAPVRDWLRARLRELADDLLTPASRCTTSTLVQASVWDPRIATRRDALVGTLESRLDTAQRLAVRTGELAAPRDPTHLAAELVGPLLYWTLLKAVPVPEPVIDDLVDRALRAGPRS
jgi:AcrR family transcriptional regulator